jgi:predicted transcriptional regulator
VTTTLKRTLVLEVTYFEDVSEGLTRSVRALRAVRDSGEVRQVSPEAARKLLTMPVLKTLRAIRQHRPRTLTALADAVDRPAAQVKADLAVLQELGIVAVHDAGKASGPKKPELLYDAVELRLKA